jgi:class 3 adenylate cyclase
MWTPAADPDHVRLDVGNIVVGNIGSADRMNYTVLGATVKSGGTA